MHHVFTLYYNNNTNQKVKNVFWCPAFRISLKKKMFDTWLKFYWCMIKVVLIVKSCKGNVVSKLLISILGQPLWDFSL